LTGEQASVVSPKLTQVADAFAAAKDVVLGALLDVPCGRAGRIASYALQIYMQAGRSHAMPPANITEITPEERQSIVAWYEAATGTASQ
jgi:uncharacterized membrane protein